MKFIEITLLILSVLISLILSREIDDRCILPRRRVCTKKGFGGKVYRYDIALNQCVKTIFCQYDPTMFFSLRECEKLCLQD